jgi:hypothetical protein
MTYGLACPVDIWSFGDILIRIDIPLVMIQRSRNLGWHERWMDMVKPV